MVYRQTADVILQRHSSSDRRTNSDQRGPKSLRNQNEVPLLICVLVTLAGWIQTLVHDHLRQKIARRKNCFKINIETHDQCNIFMGNGTTATFSRRNNLGQIPHARTWETIAHHPVERMFSPNIQIHWTQSHLIIRIDTSLRTILWNL